MSDQTDRWSASKIFRGTDAPTITHVDAIARQYSELWRTGPAPDVHAFVRQAKQLTPAQVVAVLRVDLQERWQRGERPTVESYLEQYPALLGDPETYAFVNDELLLRQNRGETVALDEYYQRFPQFAQRLWLQMHGADSASADQPK